MLKSKISAILLFFVLLFNFVFAVQAENNSVQQNTDISGYNYTYGKYLEDNGEIKEFEAKAQVDISEDTIFESYADREKVVILKNAGDSVSVKVDIEQEGYYCIYLSYCAVVETEREIELCVKIDGQVPFFEANDISLKRTYTSKNDVFETDRNQNELRPEQEQIAKYSTVALYNQSNGMSDHYRFFFTQGIHSLDIVAVNGGVCIEQIEVATDGKVVGYSQYISSYQNERYEGEPLIIQGEKEALKSDALLYPLADKSSCATYPFDEKRVRLNMIGGTNWSSPSQWIEWNIDVETSGLYEIALRLRQNELNGMNCYRTIYIDGEIPFKEMEGYGFGYDRSWKIETLSDENGTPYLFYLEKGKHALRMEVTTGEMKDIIADFEKLLTDVTDIYTDIIMITGTSPDLYRDYNLEKSVPNLIERLTNIMQGLEKGLDNMEEMSHSTAAQASSVMTLSEQIKSFIEKPRSIASRVSNLKSNISAFSAWLLSASNYPIYVDYIALGNNLQKNLKANAGFFESAVSLFKSFIYSFFVDYDSIGGAEGTEKIDVWLSAGRDQAQSLSNLIVKYFKTDNNASVNLKLVQGNLVEAVVAGNGPDIALNIGMSAPVDYAARGILVPLSDFEDFDSFTKKNFYDSALKPYGYKEKYYALPEVQEFNVMFYRTDIFSELSLKVPETWKELKDIVPILARNNMDVGIPSITQTVAGTINTEPPKMLYTFLMQNKVELYNSNLTGNNLNSTEAIDAFKQLTDLYTEFGLPVYYDFPNRFRTGEMPIGIAPLSTYNYLSFAAPEISGKWSISLIPGTPDENGLNRTSEFTGVSSIMFKSCKNYELAWEFMKWWTSEDAQYRYGMEVETILGPSGRYLTANKNAFEKIPWPSSAVKVIKEQWENVSTFEQVPGNYFVSRYLTNAISDVILSNDTARTVLEKYGEIIDTELKRKSAQLEIIGR
ncbi:MAG: extracellular solute-binding protein [Ruminococcaceae bacterium]|nr:extracellular solute-binding protein [Oscillospiraceae bacterium]